MELKEKLNALEESMEHVLESDPRTFSSPYHEDEWIYDKVYEWLKQIKEIDWSLPT